MNGMIIIIYDNESNYFPFVRLQPRSQDLYPGLGVGWGGPFPTPPPSQGKGPGNEVGSLAENVFPQGRFAGG